MGAVLRARQRPGAFAPSEHFAEGKISPQGGFTPPEEEKDGDPGKGGAFSGGDVRQTSNPHTKHIFLRDKKRK